MTTVPGVDDLRPSFEGTVPQHGVIDAASYDPESGRCLQRISVFIAAERDDRQTLANAPDEEHRLFSADTMPARHTRQRGVYFGEAVGSAAAGSSVELDESID